MTKEELKRLSSGKEMLNKIDALKFTIEYIKDALSVKESIKRAVMYVDADPEEIRVSMTKEICIEVMQIVIEKTKDEIMELERQFKEL